MVAPKPLISNKVLSLEDAVPIRCGGRKENVDKWSFDPYIIKFILQRYKCCGFLPGCSSRPEQKMQDIIGENP